MKRLDPIVINAVALALVAALVEQVTHETTHGVVALLVGAHWDALNLFASWHSWTGYPPRWGEITIAASAALVNIACGMIGVLLHAAPALRTRPGARLFVLYLTGFSLLAGFGYLMVDPLFYRPEGEVGDWKQVVGLLGGGWAVRLPLVAIGAAGTWWSFGWIAGAALHYGDDIAAPPARARLTRALLLLPYLGVCLIFSVLSFWHPIGPRGVILSLFKFWFGYIGFFWGFFIAAYWTKVTAAYADVTRLPDRLMRGWLVAAGVTLGLAAGVLLPTIRF